MPHHVTQRGNRRVNVFFDPQDRLKYLSLLERYAGRDGTRIWAYCLMDNHVHFVVVPSSADSLGLTFRETHRAYAAWLNEKVGETGHLWQGRFYSCALDDAHLWVAVRYVERNPVRAALVQQANDWPWSSAAAHCGQRPDKLLSPIEMPWPVPNWRAYLSEQPEEEVATIRQRTRTGRPCGLPAFVERLEQVLGRVLRLGKRGPKPKRPSQRR
jgi:putative transposase